ncbi:hypothetical protein [Actinacidiphila acididurans]|uniref:Small CPxCG-related zinc finger protein n=1 Tax=Actinacidiphila acididurans TaxID=2784346 RepID=A0ABS2U335_9ACTN|nr:hypothetical protein [Actinacidiphila acididurans]MBM9510013.1 hypothetical protein [Actinacidiphila acididurans]
MPTDYRDPLVTCDSCGATAQRPDRNSGVYEQGLHALFELGWRSRADPDERPLRGAPHGHLWSCPDCPSVAVA